MSKNIPKMSETEIAEIAQMFFQQRGWEMFPEVVLPNFNGRPDLIGKKRELCMVVECKKSLTYPVLEQLTRWHHNWQFAENSHYLSTERLGIPHLLVAFTERGSGAFPALKQEILTRYRIGYYSVKRDPFPDELLSDFAMRRGRRLGKFESSDSIHQMYYKNYLWEVREVIPGKIQPGSRQTADNILMHLQQDMKKAVAGATATNGSYMTPFKRTMNKVRAVLERGGTWHIQKILDVINQEMGGHHYCSDSSAKNGISKFIVEQQVGIKVSKSSPRYELYREPSNVPD